MTFDSLLPPGMTFGDMIVLMAALSSLAVVVLVWFALVPAEPGEKTTPALAMASRPSSRTLLAKYLAMCVAKTVGGSCP